MLHACAAKFEVTENLKNFLNFVKQGPGGRDGSPLLATDQIIRDLQPRL